MRAAPGTRPDRRKMRLAAPRRSDKEDPAVRPIRPGLDEGDRLEVGTAGDEVGAAACRLMGKAKRELGPRRPRSPLTGRRALVPR